MKKQKYSGIGGQAVLEGIMMRNGQRYAVAVRRENGEIAVEEGEATSFADKHAWAKWPIIRGVVAFIESLVVGIKALTSSAMLQETPEAKASAVEGEAKAPEDAGKDAAEKAAENVKKPAKKSAAKKEEKPLTNGEMAFAVVIAIVLAVGIFMVLPTLLTNFLKQFIDSVVVLSLIEGALRILIFILYILLISRMKDIKRTFMYHGSEHKCINCLEHGLPLTVENVMKSSKEHRRCGTSFLLFVMLISVIVFVLVGILLRSLGIDNLWVKLLSRILLVPVIAGLSYELLRVNGKYDNKLTYILSRPGMWMQGLTTKEPTADMVEVAIAAVDRVFDWKAFLKENYGLDLLDVSESE